MAWKEVLLHAQLIYLIEALSTFQHFFNFFLILHTLELDNWSSLLHIGSFRCRRSDKYSVDDVTTMRWWRHNNQTWSISRDEQKLWGAVICGCDEVMPPTSVDQLMLCRTEMINSGIKACRAPQHNILFLLI